MTEGIARVMAMKEAVASVSMTHNEACRCTVCRASLGDVNAMAEVIFQMSQQPKETRG